MTADAVVARELKSLQDELSATQREQAVAAVPPPAAASDPVDSPAETADDRHLGDQLAQLVSEVTDFFAEAEKKIAAHPAQSVLAALVVGIVIGRLLPRR